MSKICDCGQPIGVRHNQCTACWGVNEMMAKNPDYLVSMILNWNRTQKAMPRVPAVHQITLDIEVEELQTQKAQLGLDMLKQLEKMQKGFVEAMEIAKAESISMSLVEKIFNEILKEVTNVWNSGVSGSDQPAGSGSEHSCNQEQPEKAENAE